MSYALKDVHQSKMVPPAVDGDPSVVAHEAVKVPTSPLPTDAQGHDDTDRLTLPTGPKKKEDPFYRVLPSKWKTPEFIFYGIMFVIVVPQMFLITYRLSIPSHPNYKLYEDQLSPGWIPGRKVDDSDSQYQTFRENIPMLSVLVAAYIGLAWAYNTFLGPRVFSPAKSPNTSSPRIPFLLGTSFLFLYGLFGSSLLKILAILVINYTIAKALGSSRWAPVASWGFNLTILFANELYDGYKFGWAGEPFAFLVRLDTENFL